jgi:hypothetical protein
VHALTHALHRHALTRNFAGEKKKVWAGFDTAPARSVIISTFPHTLCDIVLSILLLFDT